MIGVLGGWWERGDQGGFKSPHGRHRQVRARVDHRDVAEPLRAWQHGHSR